MNAVKYHIKVTWQDGSETLMGSRGFILGGRIFTVPVTKEIKSADKEEGRFMIKNIWFDYVVPVMGILSLIWMAGRDKMKSEKTLFIIFMAIPFGSLLSMAVFLIYLFVNY